MENDLVGFAARPARRARRRRVGTVTSGGTESVLLAVQARPRRAARRRPRPRMVLPTTAHAAFHKAAHYFGVEPVLVAGRRRTSAPTRRDGRGDRRPHRARRGQRAVVRPRRRRPGHRVAAAAAARGVRCHVDACIGGWVLPYAARLGRPVPPWTFAVDGRHQRSRSTCTSTPTRPRAPRCCCTARPALRRPQFFAVGRLARLHDAQPDDAVDQVRRPARRRVGGGAARSATTGYLALTRDGARRRRPARRRASTRIAGAAGRRTARTRRWSRWRPTAPATSSRSPTRCAAAAGTCSRRCRRRAAADHPPLAERGDARRASTSSWPRCGGSVAAAVRRPAGRGGPRDRGRSSRRWTRRPDRRGLRRPARRGPAWSASATGVALPEADGRGQRPARPRLPGAARGAAGRVPGPAVPAGAWSEPARESREGWVLGPRPGTRRLGTAYAGRAARERHWPALVGLRAGGAGLGRGAGAGRRADRARWGTFLRAELAAGRALPARPATTSCGPSSDRWPTCGC